MKLMEIVRAAPLPARCRVVAEFASRFLASTAPPAGRYGSIPFLEHIVGEERRGGSQPHRTGEQSKDAEKNWRIPFSTP